MRTILRVLRRWLSWTMVRIHLVHHRKCCGSEGMHTFHLSVPGVPDEAVDAYFAWRYEHPGEPPLREFEVFATVADAAPVIGYACQSCGFERFHWPRFVFWRKLRSAILVGVHMRDNQQCQPHGIHATTEINPHGLDTPTIKRYLAWRETQHARNVDEPIPLEFAEVSARFKAGRVVKFVCGGCGYDPCAAPPLDDQRDRA